MKTLGYLGLSLFFFIGSRQSLEADDNEIYAKHLIEESATDQGVCVLLGDGDGQMALEIIKGSKFLTHALKIGLSIADT